jgi:CRP-like cAMP-binding protein
MGPVMSSLPSDRHAAEFTLLSVVGAQAATPCHGKGDFFGEGSLNGQPLRLASAVAMADSAIMRFTKAGIVRVLREQPKFAEKFMSHLLARNARVEEDLVDQLFNSRSVSRERFFSWQILAKRKVQNLSLRK